MWNEEEIKKYLRENLKPKRYEHSLSVSDTAVKLAKMYKADEKKAYIAGLIHDCAKNMDNETILKIAKEHNIDIDEVSEKSPQLLHGHIGSIIAKEKMNIEDKEILDAAIYHTTGRKNMTLLDKIIYIADYIEPLRNFPGVEDLREAAYKNLDEALLMSFNNTIKFILEKGEFLHLRTIEARNDIISQK